MSTDRWFRNLFVVSLRRRITCPLTANDVDCIGYLRSVAEMHLGDKSDAAVIRLALCVYSRVVLGPLPTLYRCRADGRLMEVCVLADRAVPPQSEDVVRELRLAVGRKSWKGLARLEKQTDQDTVGVMRSAVLTLVRAAAGDTRSYYVRLRDGTHREVELIEIALYGD